MPAVVGVFTNNFRDEVNTTPHRKDNVSTHPQKFPADAADFLQMGCLWWLHFGDVALLSTKF